MQNEQRKKKYKLNEKKWKKKEKKEGIHVANSKIGFKGFSELNGVPDRDYKRSLHLKHLILLRQSTMNNIARFLGHAAKHTCLVDNLLNS